MPERFVVLADDGVKMEDIEDFIRQQLKDNINRSSTKRRHDCFDQLSTKKRKYETNIAIETNSSSSESLSKKKIQCSEHNSVLKQSCASSIVQIEDEGKSRSDFTTVVHSDEILKGNTQKLQVGNRRSNCDSYIGNHGNNSYIGNHGDSVNHQNGEQLVNPRKLSFVSSSSKKCNKRLARLRRKRLKEKLYKGLTSRSLLISSNEVSNTYGYQKDKTLCDSTSQSVYITNDETLSNNDEISPYNHGDSLGNTDFSEETCSKFNGKFHCDSRLYRSSTNSHIVNGSGCVKETEYVAIDCEFVGVGKNNISALGRCSVIDYHGDVIYDEYCRPDQPITDYRTKWSGIRRKHMKRALPFDVIQCKIKSILQDKVVIGHAVFNDFKVLQLDHPVHMVRDTSTCKPLRQLANLPPQRQVSLRKLSTILLGCDIQRHEHCSVEDARATMNLYKLVQVAWEQEILSNQKQAFAKQHIFETNQEPCNISPEKSYTCNSSYLDDEFWPQHILESNN